MNSQSNLFTQEAIDALTLENLYLSYETCYWCLVSARRSYEKNGADFIKEDIRCNNEVLSALERVIKYFAPASQCAETRLVELMQKVDNEYASKDAKEKIARMNENGN